MMLQLSRSFHRSPCYIFPIYVFMSLVTSEGSSAEETTIFRPSLTMKALIFVDFQWVDRTISRNSTILSPLFDIVSQRKVNSRQIALTNNAVKNERIRSDLVQSANDNSQTFNTLITKGTFLTCTLSTESISTPYKSNSMSVALIAPYRIYPNAIAFKLIDMA